MRTLKYRGDVMKDEEFMREALNEAAVARDQKNWAVGCIITHNDTIVARGRNHVFSSKNRLLHAEIDAISKLQQNHFDPSGKDFTIYTTLEPCPMCFGALLLSGIRTVISGTNLDNSGASASLEHIPDFFTQPHHKTTMITGVLEAECEAMWLSGEPAKKLLERGVEVQISNGKKKSRIYTSPVKRRSIAKAKAPFPSHHHQSLSLRSLSSLNK